MMMPIIELYYEDKDIVLKLDDTTKLTDLNQTAYIVYQDKKYSHLILKNIENVDEIELLVNNETIDIEWKQTSEGYLLIIQRNSPLFLLTYGLTEIVIRISLIDGTDKIYFSPPLSVAINKKYEENIDALFQMLDIIYEKSNVLLLKNKDINKQISTGRSGYQNKIEKEIENLISIMRNLNKNYVYFINNANVLTETQYSVDSIEKLKNVGASSIQYIIMHPEELQKSYNHQGIQISRQRYIPKKTLVSTSRYTSDTYENRMIMAFIWTLYVEACNKEEKLKCFLRQNRIEMKTNQETGEDYVLCTRIIDQYIRSSYELYEKKYRSIKGELLELYNKYSKVLIEYPVILNKVPEPTAVFLEIHHYRNTFQSMNLWFGREKDNIPHHNMVLQFSNADKIYEYYCLLGIVDILLELGFNEELEKRDTYKYNVKYTKFCNTEEANTFYFYKEQMKITLYYQPVIYSDSNKFDNNIGLFRVDKSFYTPDFILKKEKDGETTYCILDAKWRNRNALLKKENEGGLRDLVYKYSYSVVDKYSRHCIDNLWLLQGKDDSTNSNWYIHRRSPISKQKGEKFQMASGIVKYTPQTGSLGLRRVVNSFLSE